MSLLIASKLIGGGRGLAPALVRRAGRAALDWDTRQKSRFEAADSAGRRIGVFLPRGRIVRGGDVLVVDDGSLLVVDALDQPILVVTPAPNAAPADAALAIARASYHLGNRHVPLEVHADRLVLEPDHVLAELLVRMGLRVEATRGPFEPEAGAYDAATVGTNLPAHHEVRAHGHEQRHGHAHGHDRGDDHGHGHEHRHEHEQEHAHGYGHGHSHAQEHAHGPDDKAATLAPSTLLQLMRLASPSLPVGGFSYSEGLESAVDAGLVGDEASALRWLVDQLRLALARSDMPVLARSLAAWRRGDHDEVDAMNRWFATTRETGELLRQAEQTGRSLALWQRHRGITDARLRWLESLQPAPTWPVAFALAAADSGATARDVLVAFAGGWAENMAQAAIKAVPLGQSAAQRILAALAVEIPDCVADALRLATGDMQAFTPMLAILSARHEEQYSRLFRS